MIDHESIDTLRKGLLNSSLQNPISELNIGDVLAILDCLIEIRDMLRTKEPVFVGIRDMPIIGEALKTAAGLDLTQRLK